MPGEWIGDAARRAIREFAETRTVSQQVPAASFDKMIAFLEKSRGKKRAAREAGVGISTWNAWHRGRPPSKASQRKIKAAYDDQRRPSVVRLRRTLAAKKDLDRVRIQISGTAQISSKASYRTNFAEDDLTRVDLSGAWEIRNSAAELGEFLTGAIQEATGLDVTWPEPDVTIVLVA